jgi:hypothetical protein
LDGGVMKNKIIVFGIIGILLLAGLFSSMAIAKVPNNKKEFKEGKGPHGQAGKSNVAHLYLCEKNETTWEIVPNGSWGKMKYLLNGPEFKLNFNGHGLEPDWNYTLIYYPDPWPGKNLTCLGNGTANEGGNIRIASSIYTGDLPNESDENFPEGAKIWLVLSDDVDCENRMMTGWNPKEYLFEHNLITYLMSMIFKVQGHKLLHKFMMKFQPFSNDEPDIEV